MQCLESPAHQLNAVSFSIVFFYYSACYQLCITLCARDFRRCGSDLVISSNLRFTCGKCPDLGDLSIELCRGSCCFSFSRLSISTPFLKPTSSMRVLCCCTRPEECSLPCCWSLHYSG